MTPLSLSHVKRASDRNSYGSLRKQKTHNYIIAPDRLLSSRGLINSSESDLGTMRSPSA